MGNTEEYEAIVRSVVSSGPHGPYAVATNDQLTGSITFSLYPKVWKEEAWPESGTYVVLSGVTKKRAGWRASSARFVKPSDA